MNIEVNNKAKCFAQSEIVVNAPIEVVFKAIADINHWPQWQRNVNNAHIEGSTEAGKVFNWKANGYTIKSKLHTVKPHSEIGWTGKIWWIKAIHNWQFIPNGKRTKVIVKESMHGLGASLLKKTIVDGIAQNLQELKHKAEQN